VAITPDVQEAAEQAPVVCVLRGCGDSLIATLLAKHYPCVHINPDQFWLPPLFGRTHREWSEYTRRLYGFREVPALNGSGLSVSWPQWGAFTRLTQGVYAPRPWATIGDNLRDYVDIAREAGIATVWERATLLEFFSRWHVNRPIFVFRHPLHGYAALCRDPIGAELVEMMGGPSSAKAIAMWGQYWSRHAAEYIRCRGAGMKPVKIAYEALMCRHCRRRLPWLKGVPRRWQPDWSGFGTVIEPARNLLYLHTRRYMTAIYGHSRFGWSRVPRNLKLPIGCQHSKR